MFCEKKIVIENGQIEGYACVFDCVDLNGVTVSKGAFKFSLDIHKKNKTKPAMLWQHDHSLPIGCWEDAFEDEFGLYVKGKINSSISAGKMVADYVKNGVVDGLSIGAVPKLKNGQKMLQLYLYEVSIVSVPANVRSRIVSC